MQLSGLHIREADEGKESRVIEGHAVVFGQRSVNLVPWSSYREIYEVMEPGSITQELINRSDVVLTVFHDNSKILGRSVNGKGTLQLSIDNIGVKVRCDVAKTSAGNDALESIRRGDIVGMSFCYTADEDDNEHGVSYERTEEKGENGKEVWLRHVKLCNGLYDVTIAGHPAYQGTDVSNREVDETIEKRLKAMAMREGEAPKSADDGPNTAEGKTDAEREAAEREAAEREKKTREAKLAVLQLGLKADALLED